MNFTKILGIICAEFERYHIKYAFIGGFALGMWGVMRSTMDLDLLVKRGDLDRLDRILATHLYRCCYRSENVSQYVSDLAPLGSIDMLHAFRNHALAMLQRATLLPVCNGAYQIPVVIPEDLIGLKVQEMCNNPARRTQAMADIELLLQSPNYALDWNLVREYFTLFKMLPDFTALRKRYDPH